MHSVSEKSIEKSDSKSKKPNQRRGPYQDVSHETLYGEILVNSPLSFEKHFYVRCFPREDPEVPAVKENSYKSATGHPSQLKGRYKSLISSPTKAREVYSLKFHVSQYPQYLGAPLLQPIYFELLHSSKILGQITTTSGKRCLHSHMLNLI